MLAACRLRRSLQSHVVATPGVDGPLGSPQTRVLLFLCQRAIFLVAPLCCGRCTDLLLPRDEDSSNPTQDMVRSYYSSSQVRQRSTLRLSVSLQFSWRPSRLLVSSASWDSNRNWNFSTKKIGSNIDGMDPFLQRKIDLVAVYRLIYLYDWFICRIESKD